MTIDKLEVVFFTLIFLVPGYILYSTLSMFTIRRNEAAKELLLLRFLAFSTVNLIVCLPLLSQVIARRWIVTHPWLAAVFTFYATFVNPLLLALVIAWIDQKQPLRWLMGKFGLTALHCVPCAWDYKFGQLNGNSGGRWVKVTQKDGSAIGGFYGDRSFASTEPMERDLYLEETWVVTNSGTPWTKEERTDGVLIRYDDIRSISFLFDPAQLPDIGHVEQRTVSRWSRIRQGVARLRRTQEDGNRVLSTGSNIPVMAGVPPFENDQHKEPGDV